MELAREIERFGASHCDEHFESLVARQVRQHARIVGIVLHDEDAGIAGLHIGAIVRNSFGCNVRNSNGSSRAGRKSGLTSTNGFARCDGGARVFDGQVEGKRTARADRAAQLYLAAEQVSIARG